LEELNRLAAGLAHETKNPLSLIRGMAQSCLHKPFDSEESRRIAGKIVDESDRLEGRINSFLSYSRPLDPSLSSIDLHEVVLQTVELFEEEASAKGILLQTDLEAHLVLADPDMLRQILVNLLSNSLSACRAGDSIAIRGGTEGQGAILEIRDSGKGISPEDLPQVTKPYFTRREGGTGLGLAIVSQLAQAHGWRLEIESQTDRGTTVQVLGIRRMG
jgi:signal transduction histidine kinase